MQKIIVDSGPLIALFDSDDREHHKVLGFIKSFSGQLYTTWPVLTEVTHLLSFNIDVQFHFLEWVERGGIHFVELQDTAITKMIVLMKKYRDLPMDLADASLLLLSIITGIRKIITLDHDFEIYRLPNKSKLHNLLAGRK